MAYQPDNEGLLPVHVAAISDQTVAVHILLTKCPPCMGLRDGQGRTFLHVAVQHRGFSVNQDKLIYKTLTHVGAKHSSCRGDKWTGRQDSEQTTAGELDKEESAKLTDASRTLAVGSVLIATMTFSATFTRLPEGYRAGRWFFDAFVVASALAFIMSSSVARSVPLPCEGEAKPVGAAADRSASKGVPVSLSIGGFGTGYSLPSRQAALDLFEHLWNSYFGGSKPGVHRSFGDAWLDGVDLFLEHGQAQHPGRAREAAAPDGDATVHVPTRRHT
ncbi:Xylanase inhibitor protein 1 [Dichanthelium oligosanthes]|uniref:Xylanase inhibitor protein 1 n=1 Tax=Dichanthelium oligosanthes TaxID=888268 RepID=A0A1E5VUB8_9POAL|nr:Xylanase inhibitor protein 1 [Dichanthelium oligosanthes]